MPSEFYHVSGTVAKALSFKQEINLARSYKKTGSRRARDRLIKNYILFTIRKVKQMYASLPEDEVHEVANQSILLAIEKFDPDREKQGRHSNLIPFMIRTVRRTHLRRNQVVNKPLRHSDGRSPFPSLNAETVSGFNGDSSGIGVGMDKLDIEAIIKASVEASIEDLFQIGHEHGASIDRTDMAAAISEAMDQLPDPYSEVLRLIYFENVAIATIAASSTPPLSRQAISQRHCKALELLKDALKKSDIFKEYAQHIGT